MKEGKCTKSDLIVKVRSKSNRRFKAGSELSGKVNFVSVDFNDESTDEVESLEVKLTLTSEACTAEEVCED